MKWYTYTGVCWGLGQYVKAEVHSALGRSDCVVENDQYVYIFEFKQDKTAAEALKQIDENGYAAPYASCGKKIMKIGANFSTEKKRDGRIEGRGHLRWEEVTRVRMISILFF